MAGIVRRTAAGPQLPVAHGHGEPHIDPGCGDGAGLVPVLGVAIVAHPHLIGAPHHLRGESAGVHGAEAIGIRGEAAEPLAGHRAVIAPRLRPAVETDAVGVFQARPGIGADSRVLVAHGEGHRGVAIAIRRRAGGRDRAVRAAGGKADGNPALRRHRGTVAVLGVAEVAHPHLLVILRDRRGHVARHAGIEGVRAAIGGQGEARDRPLRMIESPGLLDGGGRETKGRIGGRDGVGGGGAGVTHVRTHDGGERTHREHSRGVARIVRAAGAADRAVAAFRRPIDRRPNRRGGAEITGPGVPKIAVIHRPGGMVHMGRDLPRRSGGHIVGRVVGAQAGHEQALIVVPSPNLWDGGRVESD